MTKINNCFNPNCKDPTEVYVEEHRFIGSDFWIECQTCGMRGPKSTKSRKDAMRLWEETRVQYVIDAGELSECDVAIKVLVQHTTKLKEEYDQVCARRNELMKIYEAKQVECLDLKARLETSKINW